MDILQNTIEERDNCDCPDLVIFVASDLETFLTQAQGHGKRRDWLLSWLGILHAECLETLWILIHQVDDKSERARQVLVKDAPVLHD